MNFRIPGVIDAIIVSNEGVPIASMLPRDVDEKRIAAMTATLLSLSKKAIKEMRKGDFDQIHIKGVEGYLLVMQAGPNKILLVSTTKDARLGLILLDLRRICEKIAHTGDFFDDDDDRYPYPYIFKPPEHPGDFEMATQLQVNKFIDKEPENGIYCQYCGMKLTDEERISHNCRKSP